MQAFPSLARVAFDARDLGDWDSSILRGALASFPRIFASVSHQPRCLPRRSGAYAWHAACLLGWEEDAVLSCDYNGWNDAPEDEREALDAYEAAAEKARVAVGSGRCPPAGGSMPTEGR